MDTILPHTSVNAEEIIGAIVGLQAPVGVLVEAFENIDTMTRDMLTFGAALQGISVYAVKCFPKGDEVDGQWSVEFNILFDDIVQCEVDVQWVNRIQCTI